MSAGQMTAFSALVSVCSGLGSIVTLLVLLAKPVRDERHPRGAEMYAARGHAGDIL